MTKCWEKLKIAQSLLQSSTVKSLWCFLNLLLLVIGQWRVILNRYQSIALLSAIVLMKSWNFKDASHLTLTVDLCQVRLKLNSSFLFLNAFLIPITFEVRLVLFFAIQLVILQEDNDDKPQTEISTQCFWLMSQLFLICILMADNFTNDCSVLKLQLCKNKDKPNQAFSLFYISWHRSATLRYLCRAVIPTLAGVVARCSSSSPDIVSLAQIFNFW